MTSLESNKPGAAVSLAPEQDALQANLATPPAGPQYSPGPPKTWAMKKARNDYLSRQQKLREARRQAAELRAKRYYAENADWIKALRTAKYHADKDQKGTQ